jgi:hypothetical protein
MTRKPGDLPSQDVSGGVNRGDVKPKARAPFFVSPFSPPRFRDDRGWQETWARWRSFRQAGSGSCGRF